MSPDGVQCGRCSAWWPCRAWFLGDSGGTSGAAPQLAFRPQLQCLVPSQSVLCPPTPPCPTLHCPWGVGVALPGSSCAGFCQPRGPRTQGIRFLPLAPENAEGRGHHWQEAAMVVTTVAPQDSRGRGPGCAGGDLGELPLGGQRHRRLLSCGADVGLGEDDGPAGEMTGEEVGMRLPGPWTPGRPGRPTEQDTPASRGGHALWALEDLKVTALWPEECWERAAPEGSVQLCWAEPRSASRRRPGRGGAPGAPPAPHPDPHHPPQERGRPRSKFCPSHVGGAGEPDLQVFRDAETAVFWSHQSEIPQRQSWDSVHITRVLRRGWSRVPGGQRRTPPCQCPGSGPAPSREEALREHRGDSA